MENTSIVDVLIENITTDQQLLQEVEVKSNTLKEEKLTIVNRLKEQRKDISVLLKYADEAQQQKLTSLGFDFSEPQKGGNSIATIAFDLIIKAKENQLTDEALYEGYVQSLKNKEEAVNYAAFNIKCRSLFNTQKLLRKKSKDSKSSKEDIISLNGRVLNKEELPKNTKTEKAVQEMEPNQTSQNKKKNGTVSK